MKIGDRLDGHMIQGHVDQIGKCIKSETKNGSWEYTIEYEKSDKSNGFKVAIIPYTYKHTSFQNLENGNDVNLEFDILGKYLTKMAKNYG